ncbi:MAG: hypothetical protein JWO62_558 [Acidimicrobiaceae bacterium]|nr:hypothetical protein [Acidimicrobiaceae bacterium]
MGNGETVDDGHGLRASPLVVGFDGSAGDELGEVVLGDAHVPAELVEADAPFGDQPADEPRAGAQSGGGLLNGQESLHAATVDAGRPGFCPALRPGSCPGLRPG